MSERLPRAELVLYATEDGSAQFFLRAEGGTAWMSQLELAHLFQTTKQNISLHVRNVLAEGELQAESVVKLDLTTAADGKRYRTQLYNLDMILAIGYRVKSPRGTQFRQWATTHLKEYLIKGFVMDDERLKGGERWDYFDELLQRIRDIRSSEKRFYQKVRDLFALSVDYADNGEATGLFFAEVQNKMFFAVTGHTAAELIVQRADPTEPNMALTSWKGGRVRKADVTVAKNYLNSEELDQLNRIVSMFLDFAEMRVMQRKDLRMTDWRTYVDSFMTFNEQPLLQGPGRMSREAMTTIVHERYEQFDAARQKAEALEADDADLRQLEQVEKQISSRKAHKERNDVA
ncbi:virulence RhuM family protein [Burkholderia ubonensis]|uniref:virulence RhuM family protein n=1 Tax=Burkholderia ubonensis TaxID=101571 RepID=UPI000756B3B0|nr:virulence RhuM family protein [Burkholderia ubonensis]KVG26715.1 hydroxyacid dehydrogenase [Burkholderia ubonensis]OJA64219.1 hydroxyacid dehydrogenase [Burkholderia ubonensis]